MIHSTINSGGDIEITKETHDGKPIRSMVIPKEHARTFLEEIEWLVESMDEELAA